MGGGELSCDGWTSWPEGELFLGDVTLGRIVQAGANSLAVDLSVGRIVLLPQRQLDYLEPIIYIARGWIGANDERTPVRLMRLYWSYDCSASRHAPAQLQTGMLCTPDGGTCAVNRPTLNNIEARQIYAPEGVTYGKILVMYVAMTTVSFHFGFLHVFSFLHRYLQIDRMVVFSLISVAGRIRFQAQNRKL